MKRRQFVQDLAILGVAAGVAPRAAPAADDDAQLPPDPPLAWLQPAGPLRLAGSPLRRPRLRRVGLRDDGGVGLRLRPPAALRTGPGAAATTGRSMREEPLQQIDRAVELGKQYGIHVNINFHRIPGYCINGREMEPADLFSGRKAERERALDAAVFHWKTFATPLQGDPQPPGQLRPHQRAALGEALRGLPVRALRRDRARARRRNP